jgi:ParB family chromosome partitioning protein
MKAHQYSEIFPMLADDSLKELAADIKANGLQEPILTYQGQILDGRNRLRACQLAGVEPAFQKASVATDEEALALVMSLNLHRRHLNESQRAMVGARVLPFYEAAAEEKKRLAGIAARQKQVDQKPIVAREHPPSLKTGVATNLSQPQKPDPAPRAPMAREQAAAAVNVSGVSVQSAKRVLESAVPEVVKAIEAGKLAVSAAAKVVNMDHEDQKEVARLVVSGEAASGAEAISKVKPHVAHNSGENEWYTPSPYLEAARATMGAIDLDPSSCDIANERVKASRFYSKEQDGLKQTWAGRVWMNPPYEKGLIDRFAEKLAASVQDGTVAQACVLVNNATETQWFRRMVSVASGVCFPTGRVRFISPQGEKGAPLQGQAVIYIGADFGSFATHFKQFGFVAEVRHG